MSDVRNWMKIVTGESLSEAGEAPTREMGEHDAVTTYPEQHISEIALQSWFNALENTHHSRLNRAEGLEMCDSCEEDDAEFAVKYTTMSMGDFYAVLCLGCYDDRFNEGSSHLTLQSSQFTLQDGFLVRREDREEDDEG